MKFIELLQSLGIPYREVGQHHHATSGWLSIDCPFCSKDSKSFRMGYNLDSGYFSCYLCGSKSFTNTMMELLDLPFREVYQLTKDLERPKYTPHEFKKGKLKLPNALGKLLPPHKEYLTKRGFDAQKVSQLWQLQGIGIYPRYGWRIFIPIIYLGEIVSWTTRGLTDKEPRYINAGIREESIPAKSLLFGEDLAKFAVVVCEGPFDCFRIGPGSVATMGIGFSRKQVKRIAKYPTRVICFDAEENAQKRAKKLCDQLEAFPGETYNVVLTAKDPGSASEKEIKQLRQQFLE